jgi:hypothetical protein
MPQSQTLLASALASSVEAYRESDNLAELLDSLATIASSADPEQLAAAAEPYGDIPEVAGPLYEHIVAARPDDARAIVRLANAYWLSGRGPQVVGELASRAIAADPDERGGWHLWALSESDPRARTSRWEQVCERFPADELARVLLADNAASLAGAESDPEALSLAIRTYESLLATALPEQQQALRRAITTLEAWRL